MAIGCHRGGYKTCGAPLGVDASGAEALRGRVPVMTSSEPLRAEPVMVSWGAPMVQRAAGKQSDDVGFVENLTFLRLFVDGVGPWKRLEGTL